MTISEKLLLQSVKPFLRPLIKYALAKGKEAVKSAPPVGEGNFRSVTFLQVDPHQPEKIVLLIQDIDKNGTPVIIHFKKLLILKDSEIEKSLSDFMNNL